MVVTVVFLACSGIVSGVFLVGVFFSSPTEKVSVLNDSLGQEPMLSLCKIRKHNLGTLFFFLASHRVHVTSAQRGGGKESHVWSC